MSQPLFQIGEQVIVCEEGCTPFSAVVVDMKWAVNCRCVKTLVVLPSMWGYQTIPNPYGEDSGIGFMECELRKKPRQSDESFRQIICKIKSLDGVTA